MDVGVLGCAGRMGRAVMAEVLAGSGPRLVGGCDRPGHEALGRDLGVLAGREPTGVPAGDDATALIAAADVVIEFSTPAASLGHARLCAEHGTGHVIGTTGFEDEQTEELRRLAERTAILWAPNMSLGVNLLLALAERVGSTLGPEAFDAEIVEMHHRNKVDAPSGTALALGRAVARGRGVAFESVARLSREGLTGARPAGEIGFATLRGGDVVGEHTVVFAGPGERIELTHRATDRHIFARGSVRAAQWLAGRPAGLYGMADVLELDAGDA
jgi:4-hydroxy-tetrahydrodipicolinate reductase